MSVPLIEVFSSVQGEGKYVGCRQIFVRFPDCNLRCSYCDTDFDRASNCRIERRAGSMTFDELDNPISIDTLIRSIERLSSEVPTHSISLTGGEPLLHVDSIREIARGLRGVKIFLETNGTLSSELERVIDLIDIISMDIKLPHVIGRDLLDEHRRFLELARRKDHYVKIVLDGETALEEFEAALEMLRSVSSETMLIFQPVTPVKPDVRPLRAEVLLKFQASALKYLSDVRVIPQTHRAIDVL